jgi:hypothetical protein
LAYKTTGDFRAGTYPILHLLQLWSEALSALDTIREELISSVSDELQSTYSAAVVKAQSFEGLAMRMMSINPQFVLPQSDAASPLLRERTQGRSGDNPKVVAEMVLLPVPLYFQTFCMHLLTL